MSETSGTSPITIELPITNINKKANIVLDMSSFDLFQLCQRRYHYRHGLLRDIPIHKKSSALDSGGLAHEGLEVYFNELKKNSHYNDRMQACLMKIKQLSADPETCNLESDDVDLVLRAVEQSCDYWRFEDEQFTIYEVEQPFMYNLYEDDYVRILITGKIDLLIDKPAMLGNAHYSRVPLDHKTYKRDFEVMSLSNQFMNYCSAVESNYLIVNRIGLQKTIKPEDKFKRVVLSYDKDMLADWKQNLTDVIIDEYLACVATNRWKMNFTGCYKFNRKCEYYDVCSSSGEEAKNFKLNSEFVSASPWDVTASLNKKQD